VSPVLITYPTWKEMFGERPSLEQLLVEVRQFDKTQTVWFLSRLNMLLALGRFHSNNVIPIQNVMLGLLVDEELLEQLKKTFRTERIDERQPFHSLQFLLLLKLVLLEGEKTGNKRPDSDRTAAYTLGRCLIMTNDMLFTDERLRAIRPDRPSEKRRRLALLLQVGSGFEVNNPPDIVTSVARSDLIFGEILEKTRCSMDIPGVFKAQTGISLDEYVDCIFGTLAYYLVFHWQQVLENASLACVNTKTFLAPVQLAAAKWWQIEQTTVADLMKALEVPNKLKSQHDFIALRRTPFLDVGSDNAIPMHIGFVQEKLEAGLFWAIFNSLKTSQERDRLFTDWGRLFENYVDKVLGSTFDNKTEVFIPFPKFSDKDEESFDGVVVAGDHMFALEYKGGFLKAEAKYAEDEMALIDDLNRKFGKGTDGGLSQLARKIGQIFAANSAKRRTIAGVDTSKIAVVIPILVVQENFVSSEITHPFLYDVFGSLKRMQSLERRINVVGPLVLDVGDIEMLKPYIQSGKVAFRDCMMERISFGGSKHLSFHDFLREFLTRRSIGPMRDEDTTKRFRSVMERVSQRFFNKSFATP
jgi:hypothetical protein